MDKYSILCQCDFKFETFLYIKDFLAMDWHTIITDIGYSHTLKRSLETYCFCRVLLSCLLTCHSRFSEMAEQNCTKL